LIFAQAGCSEPLCSRLKVKSFPIWVAFLIWTDAFLPGYRPVKALESAAGFLFTAMVLLEPSGRGTKYVAIAKHKDEEDRKVHADMGFEQGWSICLDQLIETMRKS
jgi:uncharacterized protein YndB with AHSA1/START domain